MKFGKRLKQQIDQSLPEWRDKYLSYKDLKKLVRLISSNLNKSEAEFIYLLNNEIEKFNAFFLEQEEDFVIRHKELSQRIQRVIDKYGADGSQPSEAEYKQEMAKIRKDIVDFHGEMVLLMNYSNINYTGLGKILKKYDKRTGGVLRLPFIQKVLGQPFFSTDSISKLVKECEATIESVFLPLLENNNVRRSDHLVESKAALNNVSAGEGIFQNTIAALTTMQEIRRGSSTYGHFSLPPLNLQDFDVLQAVNVSTIPIP